MSSVAALDALAQRRVHIAGLHLAAANDPRAHDELVRLRCPGEDMQICSAVLWREGLVLRPGQPREISGTEDLVAMGARVVQRAPGSGAARVWQRELDRLAVPGSAVSGPSAESHMDGARLVSWGLAEAAVVIEPIAEAFGLDFIPLAEERFELVYRSGDRDHAGVSAWMDLLASRRFDRELRAMGAYDPAEAGNHRRVAAG